MRQHREHCHRSAREVPDGSPSTGILGLARILAIALFVALGALGCEKQTSVTLCESDHPSEAAWAPSNVQWSSVPASHPFVLVYRYSDDFSRKQVLVFDVQSNAAFSSPQLDGAEFAQIAPRAPIAVVRTAAGELQLLSIRAKSAEVRETVATDGMKVYEAALSPSGDRLAWTAAGGSSEEAVDLHIWNVASKTKEYASKIGISWRGTPFWASESDLYVRRLRSLQQFTHSDTSWFTRPASTFDSGRGRMPRGFLGETMVTKARAETHLWPGTSVQGCGRDDFVSLSGDTCLIACPSNISLIHSAESGRISQMRVQPEILREYSFPLHVMSTDGGYVFFVANRDGLWSFNVSTEDSTIGEPERRGDLPGSIKNALGLE